MSDTLIEIFWDDLTEEKQNEILEMLGDNNNWDVFPICEICIDCEAERSGGK